MTLSVLVNAGPWLPVPPPGYGGIETVVATLVPALRARGVRVVLAAVAGSTLEVDEHVSTLDAERLAWVARPYNQASGIAHAHMGAVVGALRDGLDVDVVHDHLEVVGPAVLGAMGDAAPPTLQTLHWDLGKHRDFYASFDGGGRVWFAGVSDAQVRRAPEALRRQVLGTVPLALPPVPPPAEAEGEVTGDHALVLARITADKAQDLAAHACRRAGHPLVLAGPVAGVHDPDELERRAADPTDPLQQHPDLVFWRERVAPLVDGEVVRWVGGVAGAAKERLLQGARCLLSPLRWDEPGATAVVEALGRGVPVVATPRGVLPSLLRTGHNGVLVPDAAGLDGWVEALDTVAAVDPADCRASVADRTPEAMADQYLALYAEVLDRSAPDSSVLDSSVKATRTACRV